LGYIIIVGKKKKSKIRVVSVRKKRTPKAVVKKLKKIEKKYVSVTEEHRLNQELSRLNKMIILFGFFSAIALLVILFLVFVVFKAGTPLEQQCRPLISQYVYQKTQACNTAVQNILEDYGELISSYEGMTNELSTSCQQELLAAGTYQEYATIAKNVKKYIVE